MTKNKKRNWPRPLAALRHARRGNLRSVMTILANGLFLGLLASGIAPHQAAAAEDDVPLYNLSRPLSAHEGPAHEGAAGSSTETQPGVAQSSKRANFEGEHASHEARSLADWIVDSLDNRGMPFAVVDKVEARVFVFDAHGRLRGAAPALLGLARGDDAIPGIGERKLSSIRPEERTTPAGRFVAALDRNLRGEKILWVDYDTAVSMHRVINTNLKERRPQRLATPTPRDNRISYGCINVPAKFFDTVVLPAFTGTDGIVYVLPETRSAREVFASYNVVEPERRSGW